MKFISIWRVPVALLGILVITTLLTVQQQPLHAATGDTWQQPIRVNITAKAYHDYHRLSGVGSAVYYRTTVTQPTTASFQLAIPADAATRFAPQVVVFQPNDTTVGPILPVEQPPKTLALIYPMTPPKPVFDALTQTPQTIRLEATPAFPHAGTYTFAIYNAGDAAGAYQFTLRVGPTSLMTTWRELWAFPKDWWQAQMFAGFGWYTLITPVLVALLLWFVYLRLDHHQLHPHKTYPSKKKG